MKITDILEGIEVADIVPFDLHSDNVVIFDFSEDNEELVNLDLSDSDAFNKYVFDQMGKCPVGIGCYDEDRIIYRRSTLFDDAEARSIHLGIDIFAQDGTEIYTPVRGSVHSYANNAAFGDYGPTIIIEHTVNTTTFYTLYGHLSVESLDGLYSGKQFAKNDRLATMGHMSVNGNWPAHLHFQIITDIAGKKGDYPGVASESDREKMLKLCPDPNLLLRIEKLKK